MSRFDGPLDRVPLLAASGQGVRWSQDRRTAWRLANGVECETIELARAEEIALALGADVPPARRLQDHGPARVTKRELEGILPLLSKRQRIELEKQQHCATSDGAKRIDEGLAQGSGRTGDEAEAVALPFEQVWRVLTSNAPAGQ